MIPEYRFDTVGQFLFLQDDPGTVEVMSDRFAVERRE
jgi:hypothetical protein